MTDATNMLGITVTMIDEVRQSVDSNCVAKSRSHAIQWIAPNIATMAQYGIPTTTRNAHDPVMSPKYAPILIRMLNRRRVCCDSLSLTVSSRATHSFAP